MQNGNLRASRFAPKTPAESLAQSRAERTKKDKENAARLLGRLRWKSESLAASYVRAVEILHAQVDQNGFMDPSMRDRHPFVLDMDSVSSNPNRRLIETNLQKKKAESMFKLDFFEWYTVLERYITLCLSVYGISVSGTAPKSNVNVLRQFTNPHFANNLADHQFHANLLEALDDPRCALHPALGNQDVRIQLGLAKDYRNRWKDADEKVTSSNWSSADDERKAVRLEDLNLEFMVRSILYGCEHALHIVQNQSVDPTAVSYASRDYESLGRNGHSSSTGTSMTMVEDAPIGFMDDAMDLD